VTEDVFARQIWSADVDGPKPVVDRVERVRQRTGRRIKVKIDRLFQGTHGYEVYDMLRDLDYDVFNDAKLAEIPSKLEELARLEIAKSKPWMLNCMAGDLSSGLAEAPKRNDLDGLKRFAEVCLEHDVRPCAVTVLTSKKPHIVKLEFNGRAAFEQVLFYVEYLVEFGFTDVVCSPQEATVIREHFGPEAIDLDCPGVRLPGSDARDQARVTTPGQALANGATRIVSGSDITGADDPAVAVEAIAENMRPYVAA